MRIAISSLPVLVGLSTVPLLLGACGDDDTSEPGSAGRAGSSDAEGGKDRGSGGTSGAGGRMPQGGTTDGGKEGNGEAGWGGSGSDPLACDLSGTGLERVDLPADIQQDLTLDSGVVHVINGTVWIHDGATLTIPPCTRIEGLSDPSPGFIAALRGGRIVADGTADAPAAASCGARYD